VEGGVWSEAHEEMVMGGGEASQPKAAMPRENEASWPQRPKKSLPTLGIRLYYDLCCLLSPMEV